MPECNTSCTKRGAEINAQRTASCLSSVVCFSLLHTQAVAVRQLFRDSTGAVVSRKGFLYVSATFMHPPHRVNRWVRPSFNVRYFGSGSVGDLSFTQGADVLAHYLHCCCLCCSCCPTVVVFLSGILFSRLLCIGSHVDEQSQTWLRILRTCVGC